MNLSEDIKKYSIRFVPLGNSLTIGHGAGKGQSWPDLLVHQLKKLGLDITLLDNPARSGWTSQLTLDHEVPVFESLDVNFGSLLIGANDMAKGVDLKVFKRNYSEILDRMQKKLPQPDQLFLLNLPDFAFTPAARKYSGQLHIEPYLKAFNDFIEEQASARNLELVDLHSLTQQLGPNPALYTWDGLHPSAKGYTEWEKAIRPVALKVLEKAVATKK